MASTICTYSGTVRPSGAMVRSSRPSTHGLHDSPRVLRVWFSAATVTSLTLDGQILTLESARRREQVAASDVHAIDAGPWNRGMVYLTVMDRRV